jgi:hypothetical protein
MAHYINGREAKEGDHVVYRTTFGDKRVRVGVVHAITVGATSCNAQVAVIVPGGVHYLSATIGRELLHAEDAAEVFAWED